MEERELLDKNLEHFDSLLRRLASSDVPNSSFNVAASERNVSLQYAPYGGSAAATDYRELPALLKGNELDAIQKWSSFMEKSREILERGEHLAVFLYSFRGLSATLPQVPSVNIDIAPDASEEERQAAQQERLVRMEAGRKIKRSSFDILEPYMRRLEELRDFNEDLGEILFNFLTNFNQFCRANKHEVLPSQIKQRAIELVDMLVKLDNLKDMKASILNDSSTFKRCLKGIEDQIEDEKASEYDNMVKKLNIFLADPSNPKSIMFHKIRKRIQGVEKYDVPLVMLCEFSLNQIKEGLYLTPDEKHCYLRVIPHLFLLIDEYQTETEAMSDRSAINIFNYKDQNKQKLDMTNFKILCKNNPVVPLYRDMSVKLIEILKRCYHFNNASEYKWVCAQDQDGKDIMPADYNLQEQWGSSRVAYDGFIARWLNFMKDIELKINQGLKPTNIAAEVVNEKTLGDHLFNILLGGLRLVSSWSVRIKNHIAWKYVNPALAPAPSPLPSSSKPPRHQPYADAVKNNLNAGELTVLIDMIVITKSLAALMLRYESTIVPILSAAMYSDIQEFTQVELYGALYHAQKHKRNHALSLLEALRNTMADWPHGTLPENQKRGNYLPPKESGSGPLELRMAVPSETQFYSYRTLVDLIVDTHSQVKKYRDTGFFFSKPDITKQAEKMLIQHNRKAFFYPYMLGYAQCLNSFKDMGDLLFREYYLEVTRCVQFPLRLSLPWILVDHVLTRQSDIATFDNLCMLLDIYNDAGNRALYQMKKQFMFNEIEAEVQVVFEQLIVNLSENIYAYHKDRAAYEALPKNMKDLLFSSRKIKVPTRMHHFEVAIKQRTIELLGRSINLHGILSKKIQGFLMQDLEAIINRFEQSRVTEVIDIATLLKILRGTHANLVSAGLDLDKFENILEQKVKCVGTYSFQDILVLRLQDAIFNDLTLWFALNETSQQFFPSDGNHGPSEESEFFWTKEKKKTEKEFFSFWVWTSKSYESRKTNQIVCQGA
jgi:cytoplasmic FMR1 interacting protein